MSQVLADFISARHAAIVAVLEMLTAERQLSGELSSVLDVTDAECEVDEVAAALADTVEALPPDRRPVGWDQPPAAAGVIRTARVRFVRAALRRLSAEYADESAGAANEAEYAGDPLCLAARDLREATKARRVTSSSSPLPGRPAGTEGKP